MSRQKRPVGAKPFWVNNLQGWIRIRPYSFSEDNMAITARRIAFVPPPVDAGMDGAELYRLTGDAAATSIVLTLGTDSNIKIIKGAVMGGGPASSHNITAATVNVVTFTFVTAPAAVTFDVWIFGSAK